MDLSVLDPLLLEMKRQGVDPRGLGLAWARAVPAVALVPAFGLRALPLPVRAVMALLLGASIAPALGPGAAHGWWVWAALGELVRGLPVAISAAVALWAASMAGGLIDDLREWRGRADAIVSEARTPLGVAFSLLVAIAFLEGGGATQVAMALAHAEPVTVGPITGAAFEIARGVHLAVAVAAPLVVVSIVWEVAAALVVRGGADGLGAGVLAPVRSLALLAVAALLLERMVALLRIVAVAPAS